MDLHVVVSTRASIVRTKRVTVLDVLEIFGSHYDLPDLGPIGTHGLANPRDFEHPVASFDLDQSPWESAFRLRFYRIPLC